jgi:phosphoribosylformylglycinamidine (FGAM) synthase-like enzyme
LAIASDCGARLSLPASEWPAAALFGERVGRVLAAVRPQAAPGLASAAESCGVPAMWLGTAGGDALRFAIGGEQRIEVSVARLSETWETPL